MNRIYRLIWNAALQCWCVASEHTKGRTKRTGRRALMGAALVLSLPAAAESDPLPAPVAAESVPVVYPAWLRLADVLSEDPAMAPLARTAGSARAVVPYALSYGEAVAIGTSAAARSGAVALGRGTRAGNEGSIAIGANASVLDGGGGVQRMAIGYRASAGTAGWSGAMAIGGGARADYDGVALGHDAKATAIKSVALGRESIADQANTVSVGRSTLKRRIVNMADGTISATSSDAVTGKQLNTTNTNVTTATNTANTAKTAAEAARTDATRALTQLNGARTIIGQSATATGTNSNAIGYAAAAAGSHANTFGYAASAAGGNAVAVGTMAMATGNNAVAVGNRSGVDTTSADGLALGTNAKVNANAGNGVALGANSVVTAANSVSVGNSSLKRKIVNVEDATLNASSTEAVTGKQLNATNANVTTATSTANTAKTTADAAKVDATAALTQANLVGGLVGQVSASGNVRLGAQNTGTVLDVRNKADAVRKVSGVADATLNATSTEAVTGKQLNATNANVTTATTTANTAKTTADAAKVDATAALTQANLVGGLVGQVSASGNVRLGAQNTGTVLDVRNKADAVRKVSGVADATLNTTSTEAVTGKQLNATNANVTTATTTANTAKTTADAAKIDATAALTQANFVGGLVGQVSASGNLRLGAENTGTVLDVRNKTDAVRKISGVADGVLSATSNEAVTGKQLNTTNANVTTATSTANTAKTTADAAKVDAGVALAQATLVGGLVGQVSASGNVRLGAQNTGTVLDVRNKADVARKVSGVADGVLNASSSEAVTGKQLNATNTNVTTATTTANNAQATADAAKVDATAALTQATLVGGLVGQVSASGNVRLGAENTGTVLDVRNKSEAFRKITGVADGALSATSNEVVTGKQLNATNVAVSEQGKEVAANAQGVSGNRTSIGANRDDIASNRSNIGVNRDDIAALRDEFEGYVPDLEGVVTFNAERTIVDLEGARLTGIRDGDISSADSKDAVTGGQLFSTNERIRYVEDQHNFIAIGTDGLSAPASNGDLAIAIGSDTVASASGSTAIGSFAKAFGVNSVALGRGSYVRAGANGAFALGSNSEVSAEGGLAIGSLSSITSSAMNSVALGFGSVASDENQLSVGNDSLKRRISNVGRGRIASDSTTVEQLQETLDGLGGGARVGSAGQIIGPLYSVRDADYTNVGDALTALDNSVNDAGASIGALDNRLNHLFQEEVATRDDGAGRLVLGGAQGMVLGNVANGMIAAGSRDAVNGGQLFVTNQRVAENRDAISGLLEELSGGGQGDARNQDVADSPVIDFGGARLTGVGTGDATSTDSKDAVNGGQLYRTNVEVAALQVKAQFVAVGIDDDSHEAEASMRGLAVGGSAVAGGNGAVALGYYATALGASSVALGRGSYVNELGDHGFALGTATSVWAAGGMALGAMTVVERGADNGVALGHMSIVNDANTLSLGNSSLKRRIVNVANGTADHDAATVGQMRRIASAFGGSVEVDASGNPQAPLFNVQGGEYRSVGDALTALDSSVNATDKSIGALDNRLNHLFQEEVATGDDGAGRLALGGAHGMVLGNVANGMIAAGSRDAVNGGQLFEVRKDLQGQIDTLAGRDGERVVVGSRMAAPGVSAVETGGNPVTDAEAPASASAPVASDTSTPEALVKAEGDNAVAVGSEGKERSVKHVAKGSADTDAVNVAQLNDVLDRAKEYSDIAVEGLNKRLDGMDKRINRMAAMSSAQSAMAMNTAGLNTYNRLGAGVGHSDGESALAVGYQRVINERGSATFSLNGAFTNSGEKTVGVGFGVGW
ncbi:ESPR-type extended signal peptide-containing protein [Stenotrophomonas sp.]|uniref:ESPR-type extended signal peptide-containing protein n=1 Tax=Stenotrophomonas sp. TaxID=69392 RepID=UPI00289F8137|nr:ESPR-type extended signal peptide-containing protein [Stenotrophomonas sp.]